MHFLLTTLLIGALATLPSLGTITPSPAHRANIAKTFHETGRISPYTNHSTLFGDADSPIMDMQVAKPGKAPHKPPNHVDKLGKRRDWGWPRHFYDCFDPNFTGRCLNMEAYLDICYILIDGWANQITSSGPDRGIVCIFYPSMYCRPNGWERGIAFPGWKDLRQLQIDDRARSFMCNVPR